jgi:hypothetical protein
MEDLANVGRSRQDPDIRPQEVQLATRKHRSGGQISRVNSDSLIKLWVSVFEGEIPCSLRQNGLRPLHVVIIQIFEPT